MFDGRLSIELTDYQLNAGFMYVGLFGVVDRSNESNPMLQALKTSLFSKSS